MNGGFFQRWIIATFLSAGVTLALMGMVWAVATPPEDLNYTVEWEQSADEHEGYQLPEGWMGGYRCLHCHNWPYDPPSLPSLDLSGVPITAVELAYPTAGPIILPEDMPLGMRARYRPPHDGLWEGIFPGPEYPAFAVEEGLEGHVILRFDINSNGFAENIIVVESQPPGAFDEVVIATLRRTRFPLGVDEDGNTQTWEGQIRRFDFVLESAGTSNRSQIHDSEGLDQ